MTTMTEPAPELTTCSLVRDLWTGDQRHSPVVNRIVNAFAREGIHTIGALVQHTAEDLTDLRSFGTGCLREVREALAVHELTLAGEPEPGDDPRETLVRGIWDACSFSDRDASGWLIGQQHLNSILAAVDEYTAALGLTRASNAGQENRGDS